MNVFHDSTVCVGGESYQAKTSKTASGTFILRKTEFPYIGYMTIQNNEVSS